MLKKIINDKEYYDIVKEIITHPEFQKRKEYLHHEKESVFDHCLEVSYFSFLYCKKHKLDHVSAAIGGLLHDFYPKPWQGVKVERKPLLKKHGFVHAREAYENCLIFFPQYMNPKIKNIIIRHMFPLNIKPPKYKEAWVITMIDKKVSLKIFKNPKGLLKYIGIRKVDKDE